MAANLTIRIACEGAAKLPITQLTEFQGDLKTLSFENFERLKREMIDRGFSAPFFVWQHKGSNYLLDGHQRFKTLKAMRDQEGYEIPDLPVVLIEAKNKKEAKHKLLSFASQYGKIEIQGLYEFAGEAGFTLDELKDNFSFSDVDFEKFEEEFFDTEKSKEGLTDPDQVPDVAQNEFGVKRGDIWQLGNHRLMCGDSTLKEDVEKLMNGEKADMVFTDPPYGGNVGGLKPYTGMEALQRKKDGKSLVYQDRTILNDDKIDWLEKVFPILPVKKENSTKMVFFKWDAFEKIKIFCQCWGEPSALLVWDRVKRANNFFRFQPQHELIFHWGNQADKREKSSLSNVFSIQKDETEIHPTVKPIDLLDPIIRVCSSNDELILDPFLGSGSTLIACEKTGRKCYGMELDEHYCSVIIKRFQDYTGKTAVKL